jgi:hypothetical protein
VLDSNPGRDLMFYYVKFKTSCRLWIVVIIVIVTVGGCNDSVHSYCLGKTSNFVRHTVKDSHRRHVFI